MTHRSPILIFGHAALLLDTRRWVLESAGFGVVTIAELSPVLTAMTQEPPCLIVLCHTLPPEERNAVLTAAATHQPPIKTLSFSTINNGLGQEKISGGILENFAGAQGLIAAARRLLG